MTLRASSKQNSPLRAATLSPKRRRVPKTNILCPGGYFLSCCQVWRASEFGKVCFDFADFFSPWGADFFQQKRRRLFVFFKKNVLSGVHLQPPVLLPNHTRTDNYWYPGLIVNYRELLIITQLTRYKNFKYGGTMNNCTHIKQNGLNNKSTNKQDK